MNQPSRSIQILVWGGLATVVATILLAYLLSTARRGPPPPVFGTVTDFALTNQSGRVTSLADLRGHVWVADIIYTRCPGPCARMTKAMSELQAALPPNKPIKLVSLTADPEFDSPDVLKQYAGRFGAQADRWHFLTGRKPDVYRLAIGGLLLALGEAPPGQAASEGDFIHSERFAVVDAQGRIRGTFDGTDPASRPQILTLIRVLLKERGS